MAALNVCLEGGDVVGVYGAIMYSFFLQDGVEDR